MSGVTCGISRLAGMLVAALSGAAAAQIETEIISVPGSSARIRLWDEAGADGAPRHFYAISLDGGTWSRPRHTSYEILLRYDEFDPLRREPADGFDLREDQPDENLEIVQFLTQPLEQYRAAIRSLGGTVYHYLPHHCHLVKMTPAVREQVRALPFVRWIGPYRPAFRLEAGVPESLQRYNIMVFEAGPRQKNAVADRIAALGGMVNRRNAGKFLLEATLTPRQLLKVVTFNEVVYVDRWSPYETDMDIAREIGGANYVETLAGFTGQGVRGEVLDVGFNLGHVDFQAQPLIEHTPVDENFHGASTSGIIFGDGTGDPSARGILPNGQGIVADAEIVLAGVPRYAHTGELLEPPYFAVFQSASVGNEQVVDYTTISADVDAMLFDFDVLHCQSQSNTGNQLSRPQAWAKNIVSVGGIRHQNTLSTADDCWNCGQSAASIGPAADGRIKPDLSHFYDNIHTVTTGSSTAYTDVFGGTSGATPITAGHFGVFFQLWSEGLFGYPVDPGGTVFENRPHMTTSKAMLINTAGQYPFQGAAHDLTRVHQGWGMASVRNLYDLRNRMFIVDETDLLANLDSIAYDVTVDPGEPAVKFTLVYADPPGLPASTRHRVNDLTLRVTAPGGTIYWGNNGLLENNWSVAGGAPNTVDTVENVFVANPAPGTWMVEVLADEINQDGHLETPQLDADFALVVSGVQQVLPALVIQLPQGTPSLVPPGTPTPIAVEVLDGAETVVTESATLHYRFDGGPFATVPLAHLGGADYLATLPGAECETFPQRYFSAAGDGGTVITDPSNAPDSFYATEVGVAATLFTDDFESDQGWTVVNDPNLTDGQWDRGVPAGGGDRGDPPTDFDGSGQCFLTDNVDGNSDVDDGITWLISPAFDLSDLDAQIRYALWYTNNFGGDPNNDLFNVYVSNNDGASWVLAQTFGPATSSGWTQQGFLVSDFVEPSSTVRVRFEASDLNAGSVVEAGIDALRITTLQCDDPCPADLDSNGAVDINDLLELLGAWGSDPGGPPDLDGDGDVGITDLLALLGAWGPCL